ncbi:hypothetical protein [Rhizobium sp. CFBP 8752]|nr:hypothetical protein [Rhizobium sp. CFBP 8752]
MAPFLASSTNNQDSRTMMDLILVAATVGFFGLCLVYTRACDRL